MSKHNLVSQVLLFEEEAKNILKNAMEKSNEQISAAYAEQRRQLEDAKQKAKDIKKDAEALSQDEQNQENSENKAWKLDLEKLFQKNFAAAVDEIMSRSIEDVNS